MKALPLFALVLACAAPPAGPARALDRAPANTVRACPSEGPDFLLVPGTATCVRASGRIVTDVTRETRGGSRDDAAGLRASGRLAVDARTNTDYGPVRGYVRMRVGQGTRD